jgi:hypothetical protein
VLAQFLGQEAKQQCSAIMQLLFEKASSHRWMLRNVGAVQRTYFWLESSMKGVARDAIDGARTTQPPHPSSATRLRVRRIAAEPMLWSPGRGRATWLAELNQEGPLYIARVWRVI